VEPCSPSLTRVRSFSTTHSIQPWFYAACRLFPCLSLFSVCPQRCTILVLILWSCCVLCSYHVCFTSGCVAIQCWVAVLVLNIELCSFFFPGLRCEHICLHRLILFGAEMWIRSTSRNKQPSACMDWVGCCFVSHLCWLKILQNLCPPQSAHACLLCI